MIFCNRTKCVIFFLKRKFALSEQAEQTSDRAATFEDGSRGFLLLYYSLVKLIKMQFSQNIITHLQIAHKTLRFPL